MNTSPIKVLLIEDDPLCAGLFQQMLTHVKSDVIFNPEWVDRLSNGLERLSKGNFDAILLDLFLPDSHGVETFSKIKAQSPHIPIVVLTGLDDETIAAEALRGGAQDFLVKAGLKVTDLSRALRYAIERKRTEEELRKSRVELFRQHEKLSKLFKEIEAVKNDWENTMDVLGDMVILADPEGGIKRCNNALREFTKKSYGEISGQKWETLLLEQGLKAETFHGGGVELYHEPTKRWFSLNTYAFKEVPSNEFPGTVITIHDTTTLKQIARDLEEAYDQLKATQSKMLQREKMASVGQLAAGIAHEINNPLAFIMSNFGSLEKDLNRLIQFIRVQSEALEELCGQECPDRETLLKRIKASRDSLKVDYIVQDVPNLLKESLDGTTRVRIIVNDLKTFSRVSEADHRSANINECLESTITIVWNELKYKADLKKDYGDIPLTQCNPGQLNQVFTNLLINAAQSIEKQGTITIKTWHQDGGISVSISDTGRGIPEENLSRIFEPFFTTKEVGEGTGLGLSLSYDIIKKHNGDIKVESQVGKGTTFVLTLPVELNQAFGKR